MASVDAQQACERERNRLLRRLDWRFLLPASFPRRTVCFADDPLRSALQMISADTVDAEHVEPEQCDLAVAPNADAAVLHRAWGALRPGGWLYTEWRFPAASGTAGVRHALWAAGYASVTLYAPWPLPTRARAWLPLGSEAALYHYFVAFHADQRPLHRPVWRVLQMLWRLASSRGFGIPICALAQKPAHSSAPAPDRNGSPFGLVRRSCADHHEASSSLLLTGGRRSISKAVVLLFQQPDPVPRLAVKLARVPESVPALAREASILRSLHTRPEAVRGVPRVVFCETGDAWVLLGETALVGTPLQRRLSWANCRELAFKVTDWLVDLAGQQSPRLRSEWWQRVVEPALADFAESFGEVVGRHTLRQVRTVLERIGRLPVVPEHRDLSPWNIMIDPRGELVVLDWESAELEGLPALDLVYFLTYLAFQIDRVPYDRDSSKLRASYRRLLDPGSLTGAVRAQCLARYAARLDLDRTMLAPLGVLTWLIHSRSDYRRLGADVAGRPDVSALHRSVFCCLLEEELNHAMGLGSERPIDELGAWAACTHPS